MRLGMKNGTNFGFFGLVSLRGHFEEIGIVKVLLKTKPRRVGKVRGCRFSDVSEGAVREKRNIRKKYNGSLALTTLERATIISLLCLLPTSTKPV